MKKRDCLNKKLFVSLFLFIVGKMPPNNSKFSQLSWRKFTWYVICIPCTTNFQLSASSWCSSICVPFHLKRDINCKATWIFHRNAGFHLVMFLMRINYVFLFTPKMRRHFCFNEYLSVFVSVFVLGRICLAFLFIFSFCWRLWMNANHWFSLDRDGTNTKKQHDMQRNRI